MDYVYKEIFGETVEQLTARVHEQRRLQKLSEALDQFFEKNALAHELGSTQETIDLAKLRADFGLPDPPKAPTPIAVPRSGSQFVKASKWDLTEPCPCNCAECRKGLAYMMGGRHA